MTDRTDMTIAAVSTAPGTGGIAVIRVSGADAVEIADKVFSGKEKLCGVPSHTVHYGFIKNAAGEKIDEVLVTVMRAPRTFTREDIVEISTHGGYAAARGVLEAVLLAGARHAEPGEFTKRAFLNGRIDLSQAEAVIDIINAKTDLSRRSALSQLEGTLSEKISAIRERLVHLAAQMQVTIDYPDEDLEDITPDDRRRSADECRADAERLLSTADSGRIIREGVRAAIAGKPNVGKSSLLNLLAGAERAIVTDVAGTTRDVIEEYIDLGGIQLILEDTAGIRDTSDAVEKIGVERSRKSIETADLVIAVFDASAPLGAEDRKILEETSDKKRIVLANKVDLGKASNSELPDDTIFISAKTGEGADKLSERVKELFKLGLAAGNGAMVTNMRHKAALLEAAEALARTVDALVAGIPTDIVSIDINIAIQALGEITGETVSGDIVNAIFHEFCVGK